MESVVTLTASCLGGALFSLSYTMTKSGVIIVTLFLCISSVLSYYSFKFLTNGTLKTQKNNYAELLEHLYGKKFGVFVSIIFISATFGNIFGPFITVLRIIPILLVSIGMDVSITK